MRPNPVCWFEIYVQDMARAQAFYEGMLNIKLQKLPGVDLNMLAFDMSDKQVGAGGALIQMPGVPSGGNSTVIYFACEDCAEEAARAATLGGKIMQPKMSIGQYGHICLIDDTEGNMIGLHSQR